MKKILLLAAILLLPLFSYAQRGNTTTINFPGVPSGTCGFLLYGINGATGDLYDCLSGSWNLVGGAGASMAFSAITSGTNTTAAMVVGNGASIAASGSGTITATAAPFSGISSATNTTGALVLGTGSSLTTSGSGTNTATAVPFSGVSAATNSTAAMVIGTGGSLTVSGSGTINATSLGGTAAASYALLNSPTLITPALGTPASGVMTNVTALPANQLTTGIMPAARVNASATFIPYQIATLDLMAQTNNASGNVIASLPATGWYRLEIESIVTTVGTTSTAPSTTITWTDGDNSAGQSIAALGTTTNNTLTTTFKQFAFNFYGKTGTAVAYSQASYASTGTPMQFSLRGRLFATGN